MIMVDSSVWIDLLRDGSLVGRFREAVDNRDVVLGRPTELELLQGARDEHEWDALARYLDGQEFLEPSGETWRAAARMFFELRRKGITIGSSIDCCLARIAIEHGVLLLHRDHDFEHIAAIRPLQQLWMEW